MAVVSPSASTSTSGVRTMTGSDLAEVARLHTAALPHGFFSSLGGRFVRAYLRTFQDDPNGVALVVRDDGELVGYVVGTTDVSTRRTHVVRGHAASLLRVGIVALLARPRVGARFVRTRLRRYVVGLLKGVRGVGATPSTPVRSVAVLAHVAVSPQARGGGIGSMLVSQFSQRAETAGADRVVLATLHGASGASSFYDGLGWRCDGSIDDGEGVRWVRYHLDLR